MQGDKFNIMIKKEITNNSNINVLVSYSWSVERDIGIVDELEKHCQSRNIHLLRDNNQIKHGELIQQFMDKLTGGEHVITVFSKSYFQAHWCMYELLKIWQRGDFHNRIHPIIVDDCDLQDVAYRISVVDHWVVEHEKIRELLKGRDLALFVEEFKKANMLRDISQNANQLMNFAAGRLTTPLEQLKASNYAQLLDPINSLHKTSSSYTSHAQSDQNFMLEVKARMQEELDKSNLLREAIVRQFRVDSSIDIKTLVNILVDRCENSLDELLRDDMHIAIDEKLHELSFRFDIESSWIVKEFQQLISSADMLFSCLVLYAVREQWMVDYFQRYNLTVSSLYQMPFNSESIVEIITSRYLQRIPRFKFNNTKTEITGEDAVTAWVTYFDIVTDILQKVWIQVFPTDRPEKLNERRLGAQIKARHKRKSIKKNNYYVVIPDDPTHPLIDTGIREELMRRLPELPLIFLKSSNQENALVIPESEELASLIFDFYLMLDKYTPYSSPDLKT